MSLVTKRGSIWLYINSHSNNQWRSGNPQQMHEHSSYKFHVVVLSADTSTRIIWSHILNEFLDTERCVSLSLGHIFTELTEEERRHVILYCTFSVKLFYTHKFYLQLITQLVFITPTCFSCKLQPSSGRYKCLRHVQRNIQVFKYRINYLSLVSLMYSIIKTFIFNYFHSMLYMT